MITNSSYFGFCWLVLRAGDCVEEKERQYGFNAEYFSTNPRAIICNQKKLTSIHLGS